MAVGIALLITTAIGLNTGLLVNKAGVPSFVVTLAGLLIWSGVVLTLTTQASTSGTIRIQNETVVDIAGAFLSDTVGWILGLVSVACYAVANSGRWSPDGEGLGHQATDHHRVADRRAGRRRGRGGLVRQP